MTCHSRCFPRNINNLKLKIKEFEPFVALITVALRSNPSHTLLAPNVLLRSRAHATVRSVDNTAHARASLNSISNYGSI